MNKIIEKILRNLLQKVCEHKNSKIIAFSKDKVEYDPCVTVSHKYYVTTRLRCSDCLKEFQKYNTE